MSSPIRVQLSRKKGWRLPPNTVIVSRPSKWGNHFKVGQSTSELPFIVVKYWVGDIPETLNQETAAYAHKLWIERMHTGALEADRARRFLRGKNLACWCKLGTPCHADVLLEIANAEGAKGL